MSKNAAQWLIIVVFLIGVAAIALVGINAVTGGRLGERIDATFSRSTPEPTRTGGLNAEPTPEFTDPFGREIPEGCSQVFHLTEPYSVLQQMDAQLQGAVLRPGAPQIEAVMWHREVPSDLILFEVRYADGKRMFLDVYAICKQEDGTQWILFEPARQVYGEP